MLFQGYFLILGLFQGYLIRGVGSGGVGKGFYDYTIFYCIRKENMSCYVMLCYGILYHIILHYIILYYIIIRYIILCYIILCFTMLYYVVVCYIDLYTFGNETDTRSNFLVAGLRRFVLKNCSGNGTRLNDQLLQASETLFLCF